MSNTPDANAAFWMPFTNTRAFRAQPRMLSAARDMHYFTPEGRAVLDGVAGLWCVNAGHCRSSIVDAIQRQAAEADFLPSFQVGHPLAFELAERLAELMPRPLDRIFFTNSGSESVDTALKIALAYHRARGDGGRTRLIGRERGYHGVGFGGVSVGGIGANRRPYGPLLPGVDHLRSTHDPEHPFVRGQPRFGQDRAEDLERLIALHGADTVAAVIVEPLAGSTGVLVPPLGYLERLREICTRHGVLLIFDEVITAFGRLGAPTAAARFGVTPDLICMAKGLTNAAAPMGAVAVRRDIHDTIVEAAAPGIELFHGYTYSAHPLACAAGLATLDLYAREDLFGRAKALEPIWEEAVHGLRRARHVIDIRNLGLVAGIELASRDGAPGARAMDVFRRAFDAGVLIRITGDIVALSPPLIISEDQIGELCGQLAAALEVTD
ncbi:aspartate aminotransferase family protein [Phenylobacterium sp. SCN 70-31]|uniref:aspartate aminotransferase family protein n=1 Tax=Phenylobacterium sp. SCN 70-31 TaxID=1660129 RepID=UPI000A47F45C|nr:aspartate aminotransferase family protein [Phenylobacterium sp. SCN 70-31]